MLEWYLLGTVEEGRHSNKAVESPALQTLNSYWMHIWENTFNGCTFWKICMFFKNMNCSYLLHKVEPFTCHYQELCFPKKLTRMIIFLIQNVDES